MDKHPIDTLHIRPFRPDVDDIGELTDLLHQAYKQLADMGLNYTAADQDSTTTLRRIEGGRCLVGEISDQIIGTITYYPTGRMPSCDWYRRDGVGVIGQFGVLPEFEGAGVGSKLLAAAEAFAMEDGCREVALDTAEPAIHLQRFYQHRGYRIVDHAHWEGKTYESVIMSKRLR